MQDDNHPGETGSSGKPGFLATLVQGAIRDMFGYLLTYLVGTAAAAAICLYYGVPLIFSLLGGALVLAVYIAWDQM